MCVLLLPVAVFAVTTTESVTLVLPSTGESYTLSSSASFTTLTINNASFGFEMAASDVFTLTSADRRPMSYTITSSTGNNADSSCTSTTSTFTMTLSAGAPTQTVTVIPATGTCTETTPSSGGGGGVFGSAPTPTPTPTSATTPSAAQQALITQLQSQIAALSAQLAALKGVPSLPSQSSAVAKFARALAFGSKGNDVTALQLFLAKDVSIYPEGMVTGFFGRLTEQAVKRFQKKYGIDQLGIAGPKTRAKLNELISK